MVPASGGRRDPGVERPHLGEPPADRRVERLGRGHGRLGSGEAEDALRHRDVADLGRVADAVLKNFQGQPLPEGRSLVEEIKAIGGWSRDGHARLIARDQTSKMTGILVKTRQEAIGVKRFIWRTAGDQRVAGNPAGRYPKVNDKHGDHFFMNRKLCRWDDLTVYSDDNGKTWRKRPQNVQGAFPGSQIQCRCGAFAVVTPAEIIAFARAA